MGGLYLLPAASPCEVQSNTFLNSIINLTENSTREPWNGVVSHQKPAVLTILHAAALIM